MVIQCSACQTRFRLADDKIKPRGTRVRCSKCGEVFTITPPAPVAEPAPPEPAAEEFAHAAPSAPPQAAADSAAAGEDRAMDWSRFDAAEDESAPPAPAGDEAFNPFPEEPTGAAGASDEFRFTDPASPAAEDEEFAFEPSGAAPPTDELHFIESESPAATDEEFAFEPSAAAPPTDELHFVESESPAATDEEFAFEPSAAAPPTDELHFVESEFPAATGEEFAFEPSPTDEFAFDAGATGAEDEFSLEEGPTGAEEDFDFDAEEPGGAAGESLPPWNSTPCLSRTALRKPEVRTRTSTPAWGLAPAMNWFSKKATILPSPSLRRPARRTSPGGAGRDISRFR